MPTPTSRRELALVALATRVSATRAPWASLPDDEPFTLLVDGEEKVTRREYGEEIITVSVGIRRAVRGDDDDTRSTLANATLAALRVAVVGSDKTLGGLCDDLRYVSGEIDIPSDGTDLVGATVFYDMDYRCLNDSPY